MMKSTDGSDAARQPDDQAHRELAAVPEEAKHCGSFASSRASGPLALRLRLGPLVRPHRLRRTPRLLSSHRGSSAGEAEPVGIRDGLRAVADAGLREQMVHVALDRRLAD